MIKKFALATIIFLISYSVSLCQTFDFESDSLALLNFYDSLNGENWSDPWDLSGKVSDWSGITVSDGRVTRISINEENMSGDIPNSLGNLDNLESLVLQNGKLYEPIPSCICDLLNLKELWLKNLYLYGSIPSCIGNLSQLEAINVSRNLLNGHLPDGFYDLSNLDDIDLSINKFTGPISERLGELSQLRSLKLSWNDFYGLFPQSFSTLTNLVWLEMSFNRFEGQFPSIANLDLLKNFEVHQNKFTASPDGLADILVLNQIRIYENRIIEIPDVSNLDVNGVLTNFEAHDNPMGFDDMLINSETWEVRTPSNLVRHQYVSASNGDDIILTIDDVDPSNSFFWYFNEDFVEVTTVPSFTITDFSSSSEGVHSCYIINSEITSYEYQMSFHVNSNPLTIKVYDNTGAISTDENLFVAPDFENSELNFEPYILTDTSFMLTYDAGEGAWVSNEIVGGASYYFSISNGYSIGQELDQEMNPVVHYYDGMSSDSELIIEVNYWNNLRPQPPFDLNIFIENRDISVTWEAPNGDIDGYLLYRDNELVASLPSTANDYLDEDITPAKKINYSIASISDDHISDHVSVDFSSPDWGEQVNVILLIGDELMLGSGLNNGSYQNSRSDVWVIDPLADSTGIISPGWGLSELASGIELALGNRLGDVSENPIVLIKVADDESSLSTDWLSPTSAQNEGTSTGSLYELTVDTYQNYISNPESYISAYQYANPKLSGIIWLNKYGSETESDHLEYLETLISDLGADIGETDFYLVEPGHNADANSISKTINLQSLPGQNIHFIPTADIVNNYSDESTSVEDYYDNLDAYNQVGLAVLDSIFYYIDLTATPNSHLFSYCINDQADYLFEDYVSGRHFNIALLQGHDSLVSDFGYSEYIKFYDVTYELYWDLFGWGYLGGEQAQVANLMLEGGGGAGLGGVCASTREVGYRIDEDFGNPTGDFETGMSAYSGTIGTTVHELIHAYDARADLFIPSADQAHSLTAGYEPLANALLGTGMPLGNKVLPPLLTKRFFERMETDRLVNNAVLPWNDIFSEESLEKVRNSTYTMPRHKDHMLFNGGILLSMYEMHTQDHAKLMNGIYQYAKDQNGDGLTNEERVNNWVRGSATALNLDVSDYFDYWGYPIPDSTRTWLSSFPKSSKITDDDGDGYSELEGDYDDSKSWIHPNADEIADGTDNNLNGLIDETVIMDVDVDISSQSSTLPLVLVGDITDETDVDEVSFTLTEESTVTFLIWWKDGHETKPIANTSISTEVFSGTLKLNGNTIIWPMQTWHWAPFEYSHQQMEPGTYTFSVRAESSGNYPANPGEYEVFVFVNDFVPDPFHINGLVYQPKVLYGMDAIADWNTKLALGISEVEATALKSLYENNGGESWAEDGWLASYEVPFWKNVHVGKEGVMYLKADLSQQSNMVLPVEMADLKNVYRLDLGNQEVCGGDAVFEWLQSIPVVETPFSYCAEGNPKEEQTITFDLDPDQDWKINQSFALEATATSGLDVNFASSDSDILIISGTSAFIKSHGTVTITATQGGNSTYEAAEPVEVVLEIPEDAEVIELGTNALFDFEISPNPTPGILNVSWKDPEITSLRILSLDGKTTYLNFDVGGKRNTIIDLEELNNGVYVLKTNTKLSFKIIVQ